MDSLIRDLLALEHVSPVGLMLAGFVGFLIALHRGWLVLAGRHADALKHCTEQVTTVKADNTTLAAALEATKAELRASEAQSVELRIAVTRLNVLEEYGWPEKPAPARTTPKRRTT